MEKKQKRKAIIAIAFYFLTMLIVPLLTLIPVLSNPKFIDIDYANIVLDNQTTIKMMLYTDFVSLIGLMILVGKDAFLDKGKLNIKKLLIYFIKFTVLSFLIDILVQTIVIRLFPGIHSSNNQMMLLEMFKQSPILMGLVITVIGPVVEELVFRYAIFKCFKNKKVAIVVSTIVFGLLHVDLAIPDVFFVIIYCCMGYMLGKIYEKTDDLRYSTLVHCLYNAFETLMMIL